MELPLLGLQSTQKQATKKGHLKRELAVEKLNRTNRKRATRRKHQRKQKIKSRLEAEQEVAHIDELLKFESGLKVKMGRKARHQMTAELEKAERKAVKIVQLQAEGSSEMGSEREVNNDQMA